METYLTIIAGSAVVIAVAIVFLVARLWSTIGELELFIRETRQETTPILRNTDEVLERVREMSDVVGKRVQDADHDIDTVLKNITSITKDLRELSERWRSKLQPNGRWSGWLSTAIASGYQAFQKYRQKKESRKGGHDNE